MHPSVSAVNIAVRELMQRDRLYCSGNPDAAPLC